MCIDCIQRCDWRCIVLVLSDFICSFVGTVAFSHLFNVPQKHYLYCGLVGALGFLCYSLCGMTFNNTFSTFIATLFVVLASRILTVVQKCPITIFLISGIFPLVPGASVYNTAYYFVLNNLDEAVVWGINSLKSAFAIVMGIVFIVAIPRQFFNPRYWRVRKAVKKNEVVSP